MMDTCEGVHLSAVAPGSNASFNIPDLMRERARRALVPNSMATATSYREA